MSIFVSSLHSYPVKSCAGLTHPHSQISPAGLAFDRQWVIVDQDGIFMTQRVYPEMALIRPELTSTKLQLSAPNMPAISIARTPRSPTPAPIKVRIWKSTTTGFDEGDEVARWLSHFLKLTCRLLRLHPAATRLASPDHVNRWISKNSAWAPDFPAQHEFGFADAFPFLIANQASLDELNQQLRDKGQAAVPMNRFRPNIVVQGLEPYEEDYLAGLRINGMTFAFVRPCARCPIPNIDQDTAVSADEPGLTLAAHRRFAQGVLFGVNAVVAGAHAATLNVGDRVEPQLDL